jgi:hypothetical protein
MVRTRSVSAILTMSCSLPRNAGGSASRHLQPGNLREQVQDLLRQAVGEVLVVGVAAHVGEGQNRDGGLLFCWLCAELLQRYPEFGHARKAVFRLLGQAPANDTLKLGGCLKRRRIVPHHRAHR